MQAFNEQPLPFHVVTTDVDNGMAVYTRGDEENLEELLKASCSVPMAYRTPLIIDGRRMIDGGVVDSIPVIEAYNRGAKKDHRDPLSKTRLLKNAHQDRLG